MLCSSNNKFRNNIKILLDLIDLSRVQTIYIYKTTKIIVIHKDKHLMLTIF